MRSSLRAKKLLLLFVGCGLTWISPNQGQAAARKPYGGVLRVPLMDAIHSTDPAVIATPSELELARELFDTLYDLQPDGTVRPMIAHGLPRLSNNAQEYLIELRADATFHDGSSITSSDVISSWERLLQPKMGSVHWWLLAQIDGALDYRLGKSTKVRGLEAVNRLTLRIRLSAPSPRFLENLTAVPTAPLSNTWLNKKEPKEPFPPGSGPFSWVSTPGGQDLELAAFVGYPQGRPFVDRVIYQYFPSAKEVALAVELNQIHLAFQPASPRAGVLHAVEGPARWKMFLALNPDRMKKLAPGFRQAVSQVIDRQSLIEYLPWGHGVGSDEILSFDQSMATPIKSTDVESAKQYFRKVAMQQLGIPLTLLFPVREGHAIERAIAERLQVNLFDVGVAVSILELDQKTFSSRISEGKYDLYLEESFPLVQDAELQWLGLTARIGGVSSVQALQKTLRGLAWSEDRMGVIRESARSNQSNLPWIPLLQYGRNIYARESVHDLSFGATGVMDLGNVWLSE
jgi:ABC-type transport system substrate-binding protein